jgi:hypothetical protein
MRHKRHTCVGTANAWSPPSPTEGGNFLWDPGGTAPRAKKLVTWALPGRRWSPGPANARYLICSGRCATRRPTVTGGNDGRQIAIWFTEIARCPPFADRNCIVNDWNLELGFSKALCWELFFFFSRQFWRCSQNDDDPHEEDLANFGYKIKLKVKYLKTSFSILYFWLPTWTIYIKIWRFFLKFGRSMAIENLNKKHMILATFFFSKYIYLGI